MEDLGTGKPSLATAAPARRKPISVSREELIVARPLRPETDLPLLVEPAAAGLCLAEWASSNRDWIQSRLMKFGGILFRRFDPGSVADFERSIRAVSGELLPYTNRSTPRSRISGNIYTSTEYPPDQSIPLHNEMSYTADWPMKIWFYCVRPAEEMGETPIADSRKVFARIDPEVRERFLEKNVMYERNYGTGMDLSWQDVFQTADRSAVEEFCRSEGIEWEWKEKGGLRTRQVCQAAAAHPTTGASVWFNQAHLFHVSHLDAEVQRALSSAVGEEQLPRNSYYGDGSPIEPEALDTVREAYAKEAVVFPWQAGDILLLDNMLAAHGRRPFAGPRRVVVGMAESYRGLGRAPAEQPA